jgi:hypothetical protein
MARGRGEQAECNGGFITDAEGSFGTERQPAIRKVENPAFETKIGLTSQSPK